ncbi:MAG: helix-turn-helix domain-containing protein [Oscillospiraceae bacterium]|nr:helix-turn-helix domain-containing protein [Oscillospiraceae bacterium]
MYRRIRDLREDADLTQQQIAEILHMQKTTYRRYESGERELPFNIAILLAKQYGVSLDYLAGLTEDK